MAQCLPQWLDWLRIENLRVGDGAVSLYVQRNTNTGAVEVVDKRGSVSVEVRK